MKHQPPTEADKRKGTIILAVLGLFVISLVGGYFAWKSEGFQRRYFPKRYWAAEVARLEFAIRLARLVKDAGVEQNPLDVTRDRMRLDAPALAEAEDIWKDLGKVGDKMHEQAIEFTSIFYDEGAPIESKLDALARRLNAIPRADEYGSALRECESIAKKLREWLDEVWMKHQYL